MSAIDWPSLIVGGVIGGLITWVVGHLYFRRGEKTIRALPEHIVDVLMERGFIVVERVTEARAVAREAAVSYSSQVDMNAASYRDFEKANLELQQTYERLRSILGSEDGRRLEESQEAWRSFRDKQIRLAAGIYQGGSIQPLVHNAAALAVTDARRRELQGLYEELRSR